MFGDENIIELKVDDSNIKELGGIYPAQSSTWKTSSTNKLKYLEIRSINSADGVLSPRSRKKLYYVMIRFVAPIMMFVLFLQSTGILH